MANFGIDLKGRVNNFPLKANQHNSHLPILEAIVNSMQAIYERISEENLLNNIGYINIQFVRETDLLNDKSSKIERVVVTDNGIGFNEINFCAFLMSDTDHKADLGGKGVGRLAWLKAFNNVVVESTFAENGVFSTRKFNFNINSNEINDTLTAAGEEENKTVITFTNIKSDFKQHMPVGLDIWANRILKHCLKDFFDKEICPKITLSDNTETIILNDVFSSKVSTLYEDEKFNIGDKEFTATHLKVDKSVLDKHILSLFGNGRCVREVDLVKKLVDLQDISLDGSANYMCVLSSKYLDEHVMLNRLAFDLPEEETKQQTIDGIISVEEIVREAVGKINNTLKNDLKPVREQKEEKVKAYIQNKAPRYGYLLKYRTDEIKNITNGPEDKIDEQLYLIERKFEEEEKKKRLVLERQLKDNTLSSDEYKQKFQECVGKVLEANKSRLAEYITHRRIIIDLFEQGMTKTSTEGYSKENYMHNLIYPMKKTSEEISKDDQNLWLIDERLSYFFYASSDIPFNNVLSEERTDLMLFDKPITFVDEKNDGTTYDKIVIFELKRPMRDDLTYEEQNPISQITAYKRKIQENNVNDKNGRPIKVNDNTKFYLYVVCDVTEKFKKILKDNNSLSETIDGLGFYRMHDNTYIEVLSYDKIINDAKKRNQILFEKLGIQ